MKICPKCNKEWPDEFMACPLDGTALITKPQQPAGFSLNLGDANAISGGVNMSDNHSVSNNTVNTTTSNVDSHNVITNNITQVEREKTAEELKHEKELAFREECLKVYSNGIMTSEGKRKLDDLRYRLGLDENTANKILSEVAKRSERKSSSLSPVHQITYNNIKTAIIANRLDLVDRLMAQLKAMVQRYSAEEIQFTYYMLQAVLHPKECTEEYESHYEDKYWQTFWSSIAYRRLGNIEKSELLVADVGDKWTDAIPQENVFVLATVNALIDKDMDTAKSLFDNISGEHSPFLSNLTTCLYTLLYGDMLSPEEMNQMQKDGAFYTSNLFADITAYKSEHKRLQAEAEVKRVTEEKKKLEEAETKRIAEKKKLQEEADRLAEEKKKQEEAEAKRLAEEMMRQEEVEVKHLTEEKKQLTKEDARALYDAVATGANPEKLKELQEAANSGNMFGMNCFGLCYEYGYGVKRNLKEAFAWYKKAAELGNPAAMRNVGVCYQNGIGIKKNLKEAFAWYMKAADAGVEDAMADLGNFYYDGNGVKRNYKKAVEWYQKAAELSNAYGMSGMGLCYEFGNGVKQDYAEALKWYEKALENGYEKDEWITERMENCRLEGKPNVKLINIDSTKGFYSVGQNLYAETEWSGNCEDVKLCWTLNPLFAGTSITEENESGDDTLFLSATDLGLSKSGEYEYEGNLSAYDKKGNLLSSYDFHLKIKYNHKIFGSDEIKITEIY